MTDEWEPGIGSAQIKADSEAWESRERSWAGDRRGPLDLALAFVESLPETEGCIVRKDALDGLTRLRDEHHAAVRHLVAGEWDRAQRRSNGQLRRRERERGERANRKAETLARWLHSRHDPEPWDEAHVSHRSADMDAARTFLVTEHWTDQ